MHFTYEKASAGDLQQGDILRRTDALNELLNVVHPHYTKADYRNFIVLTQACDLVRRDGRMCKARYVTLCAVRPFALAVRREVESYLRSPVEQRLRFCSDRERDKAVNFVERLLNNNEAGLFYLHPEPNLGLTDSGCAVLALSVAVRADLHYDKLVDARILRLKEPFQHKLGHAVGTMYSRVGTEDWLAGNITEAMFRKMVRDAVEAETSITWVPKDIHGQLVTKLEALGVADQTIEALTRAVADLRETKGQRKKKLLDLIAQTLRDVGVEDATVESVTLRISNQPDLAALIK